MRGPHLLIVDDDALFLRAFSRALSLDFIVTCESAVESALASIDAAMGFDLFDVILCDLLLPRMGGRDLVEHLMLRWPSLAARTVIISGSVPDDDDDFAARMTGRYRMKTDSLSDLKATLRRVASPRLTSPVAPLAAA